MPLFDYVCNNCGSTVELLQKHSDPDPILCKSCGKKHTLTKKIGLSSFQLKGGGWYSDGYSSKSNAAD